MADIIVDKESYLFFAAQDVANVWWEHVEYLKGCIEFATFGSTQRRLQRRMLKAQARGIVTYDRTYQMGYDEFEKKTANQIKE